jgi:PAS domain S-box-containing protein
LLRFIIKLLAGFEKLSLLHLGHGNKKMTMKPSSKQFNLRTLRRARWLVFILATFLVFLGQAFNYWGLGISLSFVVINLLIGLFIAFLMTEVGFSYFTKLQNDLYRAIINLEAAESQLHWQSAALASAANAIVIADGDGRITWINPAFTRLTGYLPIEAVGRNPRILKSNQQDEAFYMQMWQTILAGKVWRGELVNRRKDGSFYTEEQTITPVLDENGNISRFIAIKQDITRRKSIQEADREQWLLAEALREAGLALSATLDLNEVMDILLDQIGRVLPYDTVSLMRVSNGRAVIFRIHGNDPFPYHLPELEGTEFVIDETSNLQKLINSHQTVIVPDTENQPGWVKRDQFAYIRSWIGAPIIVEGEIFAILSLDKQEPNYYLPQHGRVLSAFAVQASLMLQNARLFADKEENLRREQQINRVVQMTNEILDLPHVLKQVVEMAANLVEADGAAMALAAADGQTITFPYLFNMPENFGLQPVPPGRGLAWRIVESRQSIMLASYSDHPDALAEWIAAGVHGFLGVPIVAGELCLGALGLFHFSLDKKFTERERGLAELVGRQAGAAIQNARLFEETRQRARELDLLNRIIAATAVAENESDMLTACCAELARYFDVPQVICAMLDAAHEKVCIAAESLVDDLPSLLNFCVPVLGNPILLSFFDTAVPIILPDTHQLTLPPEMTAVLTDRGIVSVLMVPIPLREKVVGVVGIHSSRSQEFTDSEIRLAVTVGEEIGQSLEKARLNEQLRTYAAELERRVNERTQELADANEQLKELDRLKSKFVSDVSHELRTPITNFGMYLDLLERGRVEKRAHYLAVLQKEVARIRQLVGDILDISRLDSGAAQGIIFEPVDLNQIVTQVVTTQMPQVSTAGLKLTFNPESDLPLISGEKNQLSQVVTNLLTNAINYTHEGEIEVATYRANGEVCLRISDTGMGIDAADLPHLFDRFYRGQRVAQLSLPGSGLGLSIVKEIVNLHGGRVQATSEVGRGSVFEVCLGTPNKNDGT